MIPSPLRYSQSYPLWLFYKTINNDINIMWEFSNVILLFTFIKSFNDLSNNNLWNNKKVSTYSSSISKLNFKIFTLTNSLFSRNPTLPYLITLIRAIKYISI